jgi:hypothetical protein
LIHSNTTAHDDCKLTSARELNMWNQDQLLVEPRPARTRVRVWFGTHVVADYEAVPQLAARYEDAMRRRFAGLRVTSEELAGDRAARDAIQPLPSERLWELMP